MTFFSSLFLVVFSHSALAQSFDTELAKYIQKFNLKSLPELRSESEELFSAGKDLFFEQEISGNRNISCADCHHPERGTSDGVSLALGEGARWNGALRVQENGKVIKRHSPSLFNLGHENNIFMFWDGRVRRLTLDGQYQTPEEGLNGAQGKETNIIKTIRSALDLQTIFPMLSPEEMRGEKGTNELADEENHLKVWQKIVSRIIQHRPDIVGKLKSHFHLSEDSQIHIGHFARALGEFIKIQFQENQTPYDEYLRGNMNALTEKQKEGFLLFVTSGKCVQCHNGPLLSNNTFQNVGTPVISEKSGEVDQGRGGVTKKEQDLFRFKTPGLRNVKWSAPYMHNGIFVSLEEVIDHYNDIYSSLMFFTPHSSIQFPYRSELVRNVDQITNRLIFNSIVQPFLKLGLGLSRDEKEALRDFLQNGISRP